MDFDTRLTFQLFLLTVIIFRETSAQNSDGESASLMCFRPTQPLTNMCPPKLRRYDISRFGYEEYFHGWADVQGQGAQNDYCRILGAKSDPYLSCALAGTHGEDDDNYNSAKGGFNIGVWKTWYMKDEDGDGREDYCRCMLNDQNVYNIVCTKAGKRGFYGSSTEKGKSNTFEKRGTSNCNRTELRPEFGAPYIIPIYPFL